MPENLMMDFFAKRQIDHFLLEKGITFNINQFLNPYWEGTTSKINWDKYEKTEIYFLDVIDHHILQNTLFNSKLKILQSCDLILYYSGAECTIRTNSVFLTKYLYEFMDEFCFLESVIVFDYPQISQKRNQIDMLEIRILDYICGNI